MSSVTIEYGEEGPKHDPYGWTEITVDRPNGVSVTIHYGLAEWVRTPEGTKIDSRTNDPERIARIFTTYAGVTPQIAERAYQKYRSKCRECGCPETESKAGYPGETFDVCVNCGAMVDYHFNESAII